jgi:hypothetical protein
VDIIDDGPVDRQPMGDGGRGPEGRSRRGQAALGGLAEDQMPLTWAAVSEGR